MTYLLYIALKFLCFVLRAWRLHNSALLENDDGQSYLVTLLTLVEEKMGQRQEFLWRLLLVSKSLKFDVELVGLQFSMLTLHTADSNNDEPQQIKAPCIVQNINLFCLSS